MKFSPFNDFSYTIPQKKPQSLGVSTKWCTFANRKVLCAPESMLQSETIYNYIKVYHPVWAIDMPDGCPPDEIDIPVNHSFFRLAQHVDTFDALDFKSYAEAAPLRDWGERLPLAVGLSLIDNEAKARKSLKLPMFRKYKGIIALVLNPTDGVVKQTGVHRSHYTWWRTKNFQMLNLKML